MAIDRPTAPNQMRRHALWGTLGVVLMLCAWFAVHSDQDATADIARPLTHTASGTPTPARAGSSGADTMRERRIVASIAQVMQASSARADFPPLTDAGRRAWTGAAQPATAASAGPVVVADVAPTAFPYQWVGLWTEPSSAADGNGLQPAAVPTAQPMAIIAGPNSTWMVKQGDVLDEDWKIASISASQLQVIYLPSMARETISMSKQ